MSEDFKGALLMLAFLVLTTVVSLGKRRRT